MMELVAMHLKQRGALVSRALSFKSCTFELVNDVMTPFVAASFSFAVMASSWDRVAAPPSTRPRESLGVS